jgi:uncharacterized protein YoaH (UPF0181 family)
VNDRPYAQIHHADAAGMVDGSRDRLSVLAEQQASLRRVATLVARGVSPSEVFSAVADEIVQCVNANAAVHRLDGDTLTIVAVAGFDSGAPSTPIVGETFPVFGSDDDNIAAMVLRTGKAARMDSHQNVAGPIAARLRKLGLDSVVAAPIIVEGGVWGFASVGAPERLPSDTEERLGDFAELVATAIANAATRDELQASRDRSQALAEQQAALRRVAMLVAQGVSTSEVFGAVAEEMVRCLHVENASVMRYESGHTAVVLAVAALEPKIEVSAKAIGTRVTLEGDNTPMMTLRTGRPARMESFENATGSLAETLRGMGLCSGVSVPIDVGGRVWGTASAG